MYFFQLDFEEVQFPPLTGFENLRLKPTLMKTVSFRIIIQNLVAIYVFKLATIQ